MSSERVRAIAEQLRAERLREIEEDPRFAGADGDPSSALRKQQAIAWVNNEIDNALDLAIRGGW